MKAKRLSLLVVLPLLVWARHQPRLRLPEERADFYVSPDGRDSFSGTLPRPNSAATDGPFRTLPAAVRAVRAFRRAHPDAVVPIHVWIEAGSYHLSAPVAFGPEDSGTPQSPTVYASYQGAQVILNAGAAVSGWRALPDGYWEAPLPNGAEPTQLWVDGQRRPRARWPVNGYLKLTGPLPTGERKGARTADGFVARRGDIDPAWVSQHNVEVVKLFSWSETRRIITAYDKITNALTLSGPGTVDARLQMTSFSPRYYIANAPQGLRQPGAWYVDGSTGEVFYHPMIGESLVGFHPLMAGLSHLMQIVGASKPGQSVQDLKFEGLSFFYATAGFPRGGYPETQSDIFATGAITLRGARNITFESVDIEHVGAYGIDIGESSGVQIMRSRFYDLGGGGIKVGAGTEDITIDGNTIKSGGAFYLDAAGIWVGLAGGNHIIHNEVADLHGNGISVGWSHTASPTAARDNVVAFNRIHNLGGPLGGSSGIYSVGVQPGTMILNNVIYDIRRGLLPGETWQAPRMQATFGIQLDENSSGLLIKDNVVYDVPDGDYKQMGGNIRVVNNVFALALGCGVIRRNDQGSIVFEHNIVYQEQRNMFCDSWSRKNVTMDRNLYYSTRGDPDFNGYRFSSWQELGRDRHSMIANPMFVSPPTGNFSLTPQSPAYREGIQSIATSAVGPAGAG